MKAAPVSPRSNTGRERGVVTKQDKSSETLSPEQLTELLRLIKGADTVELKLSVADENRRSAVTALGMDPLDAEVRQVVFFDTPDLVLDRHGVVVRARRVQRKADDSVVKLRPVVPENLAPRLKQGDVRDVLAGRRPIRRLFTKAQRALFTVHGPDGVGLDDLTCLGPINVLKLKFSPRGLERRLVAELWNYPDGSRILELSTKCTPGDAFQAAAELRAFLGGRGVDLAGSQMTKTRTALELFSRELLTTAEAK